MDLGTSSTGTYRKTRTASELRQTLAQLIIARDVATDTGNTASLERILDAIGRVSGELASRRRRRQTYGGGL